MKTESYVLGTFRNPDGTKVKYKNAWERGLAEGFHKEVEFFSEDEI